MIKSFLLVDDFYQGLLLSELFGNTFANALCATGHDDYFIFVIHIFLLVFLVKLLPCLSHCFRSPIVGFYQQWAFVILHNLDSDRVVSFLFLNALNYQVWVGRL